MLTALQGGLPTCREAQPHQTLLYEKVAVGSEMASRPPSPRGEDEEYGLDSTDSTLINTS